jgi:hypothetical protein
MVQARGDLRLAKEALLHVLEQRRLDECLEPDQLHRDVASEHGVVGGVDLADGAGAQARSQPVALAQQARERRLAGPGGPRLGKLKLGELFWRRLRLIARRGHEHHLQLSQCGGTERCYSALCPFVNARRRLLAAAFGLAVACAACEPAARELARSPSGAAGASELLEALAVRFGETEREPEFDALRPKLARAALVPSRVFDDRGAWPAGASGELREVEFAGYRAGRVYRIGVRQPAPDAVVPGQYRGRLSLERLSSGRYEWRVREELATGALRPDELAAALDGVLRAAQRMDGATARSEVATAFPRARAALGELLRLETLTLARDALDATSVSLTLRIAPEGLRASAPRFASFLERYVAPIRARAVLSDATGAAWWTFEGASGLWSLHLRTRDGSLVPLEGDAARRMPDELRLRIDYATRMGRFGVGASGLLADVALTRTRVEKSFVLTFRNEPGWQLPFLVETLLGGPLRYPFEGPGSEAGWGVRETPSGTQLFRHYRLRVRETFVLRWLAGMTDRALGEFRAGAEVEAERYYARCLLAVRDDLVARLTAGS